MRVDRVEWNALLRLSIAALNGTNMQLFPRTTTRETAAPV